MPSTTTKPLTAEEARGCVTGWDFNRPDPFPRTRRLYRLGWGTGADAQWNSVARPLRRLLARLVWLTEIV